MKYHLLLGLLLISLVGFGQDDAYQLRIGGAIRSNYLVKSWDESNRSQGGEFWYDMMRFDVEADYKGVIASGQIRFYSNDFGGILIHHTYIGYRFKDDSELQIGISQVPFGIQTYASNNWFFNIGYYVGLEDDYDMGIQYVTKLNRIGLKVAFFKNSEFPAREFSRYSYDITGTHNEVNQINLKLTYDISETELGISGQFGQLQETATNNLGNHMATAVHAHRKSGRFDFKLQASYFDINPEGPEKEIVFMSAYGAEYETTTRGFKYTAGVKYTLPVEKGPLEALDFYNDFGLIDKQVAGHSNSMMNVLGMGVNMGKLYTYVDAAFGNNHPWLGPEWTTALSTGDPNSDWHLRFNINFGYYF